MNGPSLLRIGRALLLGAAIVSTSAITAAVSVPGPSVRIAEATVSQSDGKDKDKAEKNKDKKLEEDRDQDRELNGQVLEINTLRDPPELVVGSVDGLTLVRVMKTDEIARNKVRLGDYIQASGEKQTEQLFEAYQLSIAERYKGETSDSNDNDDKKKKKG